MKYDINWENIDMSSPIERSINIIEPLTFETLLLEVACNLPHINKVQITKQFSEDMSRRIEEAWEVFRVNLDGLEKAAKEKQAKI